MGWIKKFCFKVLNKIEDHFATVIAVVIISIVSTLFIIFWKWLKTKHSLELHGLVWLLVLSIFLFLIAYFLRCMLRDKGRLKNDHDIINAIDNWFTKGISHGELVEKNVQYYFHGVEKNLNLKRSSSKRYLPMIAWKHGYGFEMGKKTFKLTKLTHENDPTATFERHLNKLSTGEKEIILSCNDIDRDLGWPEGATKSFILTRPPKSQEFGIEIEDIGGDKIRIIRKE